MQFKNVDEILNKYGKYVVQQSKSNLTKDKKGGGDLYNSVSYKIDKRTGDILPKIEDTYNHHIDGIRYGLAPLIKNIKAQVKKRRLSFA